MMTDTALLGVVLTPRQIWELLDLVQDAPGDADEDVLDAVAAKLENPRQFTRASASKYQGRLLVLSTEEHAALVELVVDDVTPPDEVIRTVSERLESLVPDRRRGPKRDNES
jgi:hypothetical protein